MPSGPLCRLPPTQAQTETPPRKEFGAQAGKHDTARKATRSPGVCVQLQELAMAEKTTRIPTLLSIFTSAVLQQYCCKRQQPVPGVCCSRVYFLHPAPAESVAFGCCLVLQFGSYPVRSSVQSGGGYKPFAQRGNTLVTPTRQILHRCT